MFSPGDYVIYGDSGLCRIEQVAVPDFDTFEKDKPYYFLRSEADGSRIYTPIDTHQPLRAPITQAEAEALLSQLPAMQPCPPSAHDRKSVLQHYRQLMQPHTCQALACTVKSILTQHHGMLSRVPSAEQEILKKAEQQLISELSTALHLSCSEAQSQLRRAIQA